MLWQLTSWPVDGFVEIGSFAPPGSGLTLGGRPAAPPVSIQVADPQHRGERGSLVGGYRRNRKQSVGKRRVQPAPPQLPLSKVEIVDVDPRRRHTGPGRDGFGSQRVEADAVGIVEQAERQRRRRLRGKHAQAIVRIPVRVIDDFLRICARHRQRRDLVDVRVRAAVVHEIEAMELAVLDVLERREVVGRVAHAGAETLPLAVHRSVDAVAERDGVDGVIVARDVDCRADGRATPRRRGDELAQLRVGRDPGLVGGIDVAEVRPRVGKGAARRGDAAHRVDLVVVPTHDAEAVRVLQQRCARRGRHVAIDAGDRVPREGGAVGTPGGSAVDRHAGAAAIGRLRLVGALHGVSAKTAVRSGASCARDAAGTAGRLIIGVARACQAFRCGAGAWGVPVGASGVGQAIERRIRLAGCGRVIAARNHRIARHGPPVAFLLVHRARQATACRRTACGAARDRAVARPEGRGGVAVENLVAELLVEILGAGRARRRLVRIVVVVEDGRRARSRGRVVLGAVDPAPVARSRLVFAVGVTDIGDGQVDADGQRPIGVAVERDRHLARQVGLARGRGERIRLHLGQVDLVAVDVGVDADRVRQRRAVGLDRRRVVDVRVVRQAVEIRGVERRRPIAVREVDGGSGGARVRAEQLAAAAAGGGVVAAAAIERGDLGDDPVGDVVVLHAPGIVQRVDDVRLRGDLRRDRHVRKRSRPGIRRVDQRTEHQRDAHQHNQ